MKKVILLILLAAIGCSSGPVEPSGQPLRVVSLAPSITEMLFALGAGDMVVGVTTYCNYPEKAKSLPKVGGYATTDLESIIRLKPDLVVATPDGNPREVVEKLESLGIKVLIVGAGNFADVVSSALAVGKAVGMEDAARKLAENLQKEWNLAGRRHEGREGPSVMLLVGIEPLVAAGEGSLGDELIRQAGGRNVFSDSGKEYVVTNHEAVIALAPEIILQSAMGTESDGQVREDWSRWSSIPAVRDGRIYTLEQDLVNRAGPRIIEALHHVEKTIHGDKKSK